MILVAKELKQLRLTYPVSLYEGLPGKTLGL